MVLKSKFLSGILTFNPLPPSPLLGTTCFQTCPQPSPGHSPRSWGLQPSAIFRSASFLRCGLSQGIPESLFPSERCTKALALRLIYEGTMVWGTGGWVLRHEDTRTPCPPSSSAAYWGAWEKSLQYCYATSQVPGWLPVPWRGPAVPLFPWSLAHTQSAPANTSSALHTPHRASGCHQMLFLSMSTFDFGTSLPHHCHTTPPGWPGSPSLAEAAV